MFILRMGFLLAALLPAAADEKRVLHLHWENDLFLRGDTTDRWYTNGIRFGWSNKDSASAPFDAPIRNAVLGGWATFGDTGDTAFGTYFGQSMYTPRVISNPAPQPLDRPWAGWLYVGRTYQGAILHRRFGELRPVHRLAEVSIGMVGPSARSGEVQEFIHDTFNATPPRGWGNQLRDEPTLNLRFRETTKLGDRSRDLLLHWGYNVGNVMVYGGAGAILRIGRNLCDFGVTPQAPTFRGAFASAARAVPTNDSSPGRDDHCDQQDLREPSWSAALGVEARIVAHNLFLDGNTFKDGPSVDKRYAVIDGTLALTYRNHPWSISYLMVRRTSEFKGLGNAAQRFGALVVSVPLSF